MRPDPQQSRDLVRAMVASGEAKRLRLAAGATVTSVARALGCYPGLICRWESGERSPGTAYALRYAELLASWEASDES